MGATKDSLENGDNPILAFVLAIEGYTNLITSWSDTSAVVTAWAATSYGAAVQGLERPGEITQTIEPFRPSIDAESTTFVIHSGENDTFGADVFASEKSSGNRTQLTASIDANDTGALSVTNSSGFSGVPLYIGTERMTVVNSVVVATRGTPVPFAIDGGSTFGRAHRVSQVAGGVVSRPVVTDYPRTWVGKWVGCWVHRVVDGVLDTKAEAQLIFAGKIADIRDGISNGQGVTVLDCTDAREAVRSAVLLGDQFTCAPQEGINLTGSASITITWTEKDGGLGSQNKESVTVTAGESQYGTVHIATGQNTARAIVNGLNHFIADAINAGDLTADISVNRTNDVVRITGTSAANATEVWIKFQSQFEVAGFLGFDVENPDALEDAPSSVADGIWIANQDADSSSSITVDLFATFKMGYAASFPLYSQRSNTVRMESPTGTWVDQAADLPKPYIDMTDDPDTSTGSWGFLMYGDRAALAKHVSDTEFSVYVFKELDETFGFTPIGDVHEAAQSNATYIRVGDAIPRYKQVILIRNDLEYIVSRIFASTGAAGYNHATYDAFDYQLSADGGIPWDLLGTNFINTLVHLNSMSTTATTTLLLEKPTKLEEIILPELTLRNAHLVLKDGGLAFGTPSQPGAGSTTHTVTTSHKAAEPSSAAFDWPDYELSRNTVITSLKVKYNRTARGDFRNEVEINNEQSKSDHGTSEPITVEARNSIDVGDGAGDTVSELINALAADALAFYSKPLPVMSRSLASTKFFITPGIDSVSVTDSFVRTVATGARTVSAVPGWVTGIVQDWKTMRGTLRAVLLEEGASNRVIYSPSCLVDENQGTAGYDHANSRIYVAQHEFSHSSESTDINNIDAGDLITIIERSPATPGSPVTFDREVDTVTVGSDYFEMTSQLPAAGSLSGKEWYVVSQDRASAQATQQPDAYTGDDADGLIQGDVSNREWVSQAPETLDSTAAVQTTRHEYPPTDGEYWTEGQPVHPAIHRNWINTANNLIGYRTAPHMIMALDFNSKVSTAETDYVLGTYPIRLHLGRGRFTSLKRLLNVGIAMKQNTSGTGSVRITSSAFAPISSDTIGTAITMTRLPPYNEIEITNTSTTLALKAAQTIDVVPSAGHEYTWLTVEVKTSANTSEFWGFHQFFLGPLAS